MSGSLRQGFSIRSMPLFPLRTRRNIQYYTNGSIVSGASTTGTYVFSANGCFDPDISGTGGQPMGFDQAMTFYNHYTVLGARIRVIFNSNSDTQRASVAVSTSGSSTATTSIEQLMENGNLAFEQLGYIGQMGSTCSFTRTMKPARYQGIDDVLDDPNMRGDAASNPTEQAYFHLSCWNAANSTTVGVFFQALIEYDVMFTEPRKGSISVSRPMREDHVLVEVKEPSLEDVERGILSLFKHRK